MTKQTEQSISSRMMRAVDVVVVFGVHDGEVIPHPHEVLVFEERRDTIEYLEGKMRGSTTNNAYWDTEPIYGMSLRMWLRTATIKEAKR